MSPVSFKFEWVKPVHIHMFSIVLSNPGNKCSLVHMLDTLGHMYSENVGATVWQWVCEFLVQTSVNDGYMH